METRIRMEEVEPGSLQAMLAVENYVARTSIDKTLKELIKIRASQVNGCAFCLNMHTKEARELGETEQRIYALNAWRETPYFTPEERAVLALTEAVTLVAESHVPDDVYNEAARYFDEKQMSEIIMQIVVINAWNRLAVTARKMPE
ncbi:carboxymuconolactone decarboxylase family protein [Fictibacillus enclensis]|uniref:carboxymuconolactone decarboxylase family protein n=1 Tax=Fictibacillus enclensis TaxID=1017270 RepID=UPI0024BF6689|nr:carboxymuconolactone decarboxylase family protein [Fictibacillus enclensis]WHY72685.1 carboxymuconolactone decarboxylase family protein [Fictibacillus enclensis]